MVHVKTKRQEQVEAGCGASGRGTGGLRATKIRTRCKGEALDNEMHEQVTAALPHIVKANVEKAKAGSLQHTKWLWWVTQEALRKSSHEELAKARVSLAELLMEQLKR